MHMETATGRGEQISNDPGASLRSRHAPVTYESEQKQSSVGEYSRARTRLNADIFSSEHDYHASSLRHPGSHAGSMPYTFQNSQQRLREERDEQQDEEQNEDQNEHLNEDQPQSQPSISFRSEDREQQAAPPGKPAPLAFTTQQTDSPGQRHQVDRDADAQAEPRSPAFEMGGRTVELARAPDGVFCDTIPEKPVMSPEVIR